jgi:hypothetical protein
MGRGLLRRIVLAFLLSGLMVGTDAKAQSDFKVTLLGTGAPILNHPGFAGGSNS